MTELTLGPFLKREREHRGLTLRGISERTKVSLPLLEGLEADDISRWPGGIFRRAFVRAYAECVGLNPDEIVARFEHQYRPPEPELPAPSAAAPAAPSREAGRTRTAVPRALPGSRSLLLATAADLAVAIVLALGSAAAGSRLLWPVLLIAGYYALGTLLTGTTPMVALLGGQPVSDPPLTEESATPATASTTRPAPDRRSQPRRTTERPRQRRGVQAGIRT